MCDKLVETVSYLFCYIKCWINQLITVIYLRNHFNSSFVSSIPGRYDPPYIWWTFGSWTGGNNKSVLVKLIQTEATRPSSNRSISA